MTYPIGVWFVEDAGQLEILLKVSNKPFKTYRLYNKWDYLNTKLTALFLGSLHDHDLYIIYNSAKIYTKLNKQLQGSSNCFL